mmetsp:Transcript_1523/g.2949  ORF Transcript_1523/g.2949 Transcript_1523/m.2949 type:complete len:127 (-) Transcript_1523:30-410(-)
MTEAQAIAILCAMLGGEPEQRVDYTIHAVATHVRVDCLTETHAIEIGLDHTRSSYDSLHQATFNAMQTDRAPMVILIDTDNYESQYEYQIETVARAHGVAYAVWDEHFLIRWQMTAPFRAYLEQHR